jgi:hypothetical protein
MLNTYNIPKETIRKFSGKPYSINRVVEVLKRHNYYVVPRPIMGDAPKNFIYVYEFRNGNCRDFSFYAAIDFDHYLYD